MPNRYRAVLIRRNPLETAERVSGGIHPNYWLISPSGFAV